MEGKSLIGKVFEMVERVWSMEWYLVERESVVYGVVFYMFEGWGGINSRPIPTSQEHLFIYLY